MDTESSELSATEHVLTMVGTPDARIAGRDGEVVMWSYPEQQPVWRHKVHGRAYALAIARRRLIVSTDEGWIYCFGSARESENVESAPTKSIERHDFDAPGESARIDSILKQLPSRRGFALVIGAEHDDLVPSLAARSEFRIVIAERDVAKVNRLRNELKDRHLCDRVAVHHTQQDGTLPYAESLFDLVIGGSVQQITHLLCPGRGVGFAEDGVVRREPLEGAGEWTHMYGDPGNTACSGDVRVGSRVRLQWYGEPGPRPMIDRHLRTMPSLVKSGRMFVPALDRMLAVNVFNGTILWERSIPGMSRVAVLKDAGFAAAADDSLYVVDQKRCLQLDAESGDVKNAHAVAEPDRDWGYLAVSGGQILGSTTRVAAARRTVDRETIMQAAYADNRPVVVSDTLFALDKQSGKRLWTHRPKGVVLNPTISVNERNVFVLDSTQPAHKEAQEGRLRLDQTLAGRAGSLVALRRENGKPDWTVPIRFEDGLQNVYVACTDQYVCLVYSFNRSTVHYAVHLFDAESADRLWSAVQDNEVKVGWGITANKTSTRSLCKIG